MSPSSSAANIPDETYGEFQEEMDIFNQAFCDVMLEGDAKGRVFTFPIPTINVTNEFAWDSPVVDRFMEITCKYGIPYFSNYVNSDLSPEDAVSMCCRLQTGYHGAAQARRRPVWLQPHDRLHRRCHHQSAPYRLSFEYRKRSSEPGLATVPIAKTSLEIKRKIIEEQTERGLYPYSAYYLRDVKARTGQYWYNHFNTIGLVGMNEACLNFLGKDLDHA